MTTEPGCNLLHNMSAPSKSTVKYAGLRSLSGDDAQQSTADYQFGTPVRFELAFPLAGPDAMSIMALIGVKPGSFKDKDPTKHLIALIEECAMKLPLPEGCAAIPVKASHQAVWTDVLTILAILTKSTDTVWLRSKTPSLAGAMQRTAVSLLVPPRFAHKLAEVRR
jgi:hypothetical protein